MLDFFWSWLNETMGLNDACSNTTWQYLIFIIFLVIGVFFLVKFCDIFVDAASAIAKKMKISPLIIGLTVVAIGTSCPELAVSVSNSVGALVNHTTAEIALGNVIGSNICNLLLVLGFSAIFTPIIVKKSICKREYPFLIGITLLLTIFACFFTFKGYNFGVNRWEGIILVLLIPVYIGFLIYNAKKHPEDTEVEQDEIKDMPMWKAILFVIIGAVGIMLGGEFVVYGAQYSATSIGVKCGFEPSMVQSLVGLTIVAVGTSLPELVTSIIAAKKGQNELALGNVIGSNIFNTIFVLGIAATINPLGTFNAQMWVEAAVMMVATLFVFVFALRGKLGKKAGISLLVMYSAFLIYLVLRTVM